MLFQFPSLQSADILFKGHDQRHQRWRRRWPFLPQISRYLGGWTTGAWSPSQPLTHKHLHTVTHSLTRTAISHLGKFICIVNLSIRHGSPNLDAFSRLCLFGEVGTLLLFFREKISTRFGFFSIGKRDERVVGYFLMRHGPLQGRASLQRNFWSRSNSIAGCTHTHATIIWYGARKMGRLISELCSLPVQLLNEVWKLIIVNK